MFNKAIQDIQKIEDRRVFRILTKAAGIPKMEISIHKCLFGSALIGTYEDYLHAVELGKDADECYCNFINRWSSISINVNSNYRNPTLIDKVIKVIDTGVEDPSIKVSLYAPGTYLQRKVWEAIRTIEPGKTMSYKDIAAQIGNPKAVRAIGSSCGANPIAIIVPCHRVVKSDGSEGGYRWGLDIKRKLLQREIITNRGI
jgi:AraC family transcriptional regulator of adaptative response/methylated-DNA-[protein]-cysteine methyltransferase